LFLYQSTFDTPLAFGTVVFWVAYCKYFSSKEKNRNRRVSMTYIQLYFICSCKIRCTLGLSNEAVNELVHYETETVATFHYETETETVATRTIGSKSDSVEAESGNGFRIFSWQ
jgi:hypothetical protein